MTNLSPSSPANRIPPAWQAAKLAWSDAGHAIGALSSVFLIALAANVVGEVVALLSVRGRAPDGSATLVISFLIGVVQGFFLTPYFIAVHRLIILDEVAPGYGVNFRGERFMRFFGWSVLITGCAALAALIARNLPLTAASRALLFALIGLAFVILALRIVIFFPAIAVEAAGARPRNALADTRGHAWRILWLMVVAFLPILAVGAFAGLAVGWLTDFEEGTLAETVVNGVIEMVWITLVLVIASRLFQWLGNRCSDSDAHPAD